MSSISQNRQLTSFQNILEMERWRAGFLGVGCSHFLDAADFFLAAISAYAARLVGDTDFTRYVIARCHELQMNWRKNLSVHTFLDAQKPEGDLGYATSER